MNTQDFFTGISVSQTQKPQNIINGKDANKSQQSTFHTSQSGDSSTNLKTIQSLLAADNASSSEEEEKYSTSSDAPELRQCEQCGTAFNTEAKLIRHLLCHTSLVPARCQLCRKNFSKQSRLAEHIMCVHAGVKRFVCTFCSARFSWRSTYMRHLRRQHGSTENHPSTSAPTSSVAFSSFNALQHECEHCSNAFAQRRELVKHVRQNHKDVLRDQAMKVEQCTTDKAQPETLTAQQQQMQVQLTSLSNQPISFQSPVYNLLASNHSMVAQPSAAYNYPEANFHQRNTHVAQLGSFSLFQQRAHPLVREELGIPNMVQAQFCVSPTSLSAFRCPLCTLAVPSRIALEQHVNSEHTHPEMGTILSQRSMIPSHLTMTKEVAPFQLYFDDDNEPRVLLNL